MVCLPGSILLSGTFHFIIFSYPSALKKVTFILLLFAASLESAAQPFGEYTIKWNEPLQPLYNNFKIWFDSSGNANINDILTGRVPATAFRDYNDSLEFDWYRVCWLKVTLHAPFSFKNYSIGLRNDFAPGAHSGSGRTSAYIIEKGKVTSHYEIGNQEPGSKKLIKDPVNAQAFPISLDSGQSVDIYIREYDQDYLFRNTSFALMHPEIPFVNPKHKQLGVWIYVFGVMSILFAFGLVFYFITRQQSFLWFALCAMSHGFHALLVDPRNLFVKWFMPEHSYYQYFLVQFFIVTNIIFFLQFSRSFAKTSTAAPWVDKLLLLNIAWGIFYAGFYFFDFNKAWGIFATFNWLFYITIPVLIITSIRLLLIKKFTTRCLGIAMLLLSLFQAMGMFWQKLGFYKVWDINPWIVGPIAYMIIIFFGLAYNFRTAEKQKQEAERVKEIDKIKSRFFANISHEFRTPLSLMIGPLKQMEQGKMDEDSSKKYMKMMRHNGERLLHLINQMLDLSKLESGKLRLQVSKTDITGLLKATVYSFNSMAEQKQVNYYTHFPEHEIIGWVDKDKFQKIVTNLLSNAFKFTPENGSVSVDVENGDKRIRITVQDSGPGIPKEQLDKIFDRFYQVEGTEGGTGIGLSLVKELVQLHKGQISVSSDTGRGASFRLSIPVAREFYTDEEVEISGREIATVMAIPATGYSEEEAKETIGDSSLPTVLIVEDNTDLQQFISDTIKKEFNVALAGNGKEGIEKALLLIPDLIVTDVMMPVMDGVVMTNELKKNEKTSHVPVIMLTAKATAESKIEGLKTGADDYLVKPFDGDELIARIQNLIEQRQKLRELYSKKIISIKPDKVEVQSQESVFLEKIRTAIDENLDNEMFGVVGLANAVNMSRSQLHRKLKALTGDAPNELIRNFRLERARELLQKNAGNITEVAFMTGFSSPAYFSKCFNDRYGFSPTEIKKNGLF